MRTTQTNPRGQRGYSLVWVIAAMTIMSALSAAVLTITDNAKTNEMMLTFDTQARLLAESGMNYAGSKAADILSGATNTPPGRPARNRDHHGPGREPEDHPERGGNPAQPLRLYGYFRGHREHGHAL